VLNALAAPVSTSLVAAGSGDYEYRWSSPSLLASYAQMLKQDVVGKLIFSCARCGALFVASHPHAAYCPDGCAEIVQKQRQRKRKART
jgi:hypothetical protein